MKFEGVESMRAFVGLEVERKEVLEALAHAQEELAGTKAELKMVRRENLHFTVKFLGEISEGEAAEADSRLRGVHLAQATVRVEGVGAFPDARRPRVVWAGVAKPDEPRVSMIASAVISTLRGIGEEDERPFSPHITLARVRSPRNGTELSSFLRANASRTFGETRVATLKLKSSALTPSGPEYSDVGVYPLG
jgi:RNA 2',3'-cyclic 3'-phosphodiesterase